MDIKLIPADGGPAFTFPSLPETLKGKYYAKYQSFDIISKGTVKVPRGTDASEFSWDGVFFGVSKKDEAIVRTGLWREPGECVGILEKWLEEGKVLNLIVTETWINVDVTISSFQPGPTGAYGNIAYSITFVQKRPLQIYDTSEMKIEAYVKNTRPRNDSGGSGGGGNAGGTYTVVSGDTLSGIAARKCGGAGNWKKLYDANAAAIEAAARAHGKADSDHGHWIWPGQTLQLV